MNISVNWLGDLLGQPLDPLDVARDLTLRCAPIDSVEAIHQELGDVVIGLVESVARHPNADRLSLCRVNTGAGLVEVVCGAPNVAAGHKYPFAPIGAVLPGGLALSARKIRGVTSQGMLCSARELGLGTDHEGILEMSTEAPPGTRLLDVLPVADTRLVLDVPANRPDLLGHKGVARELAAYHQGTVKLTPIPGASGDVPAPRRAERVGTVDGVEVRIEDPAGCPRYMAAVLRGVRVAPSPAWLQARLHSVGARPINNVVDATNYILYELNQPLHAFDLARLAGNAVVIRAARRGERLTTLDGETRALSPEMTLIGDADAPQAIAGVMGGIPSEVTPETTDILLECAYFDPKRVRATRKALRMSTEASYRFERGTDIQAMGEAVRRAVALLRAVAGGAERESAVDVYPQPIKPRAVFVAPQRVSALLGTTITREEIERHLTSVGFTVAPKEDRLHVQVPGWRPDVTREVDLIEEVARLRGYDSFATEVRPFRPSGVPDDPIEELKARIRRLLTGLGFHEARTLPLVGAPGDETRGVALANPMSADQGWLRDRLLPGLISGAEYNWSVRERNVRLFELGAIFRRDDQGAITEQLRVASVLSGARNPMHWTDGGHAPDYDAWDVKAIFEALARVAGPEGMLHPDADGWAWDDAAGRRRGWAGRLSGDRPAWAAALFGCELDIEPTQRAAVSYRPLPATPPVERDVALVLPAGVSRAQVEALAQQEAGALLERMSPFDQYRGGTLVGRSVAWHLVFRAPDRTLRDEEADQVIDRILRVLKEQLDVVRREA